MGPDDTPRPPRTNAYDDEYTLYTRHKCRARPERPRGRSAVRGVATFSQPPRDSLSCKQREDPPSTARRRGRVGWPTVYLENMDLELFKHVHVFVSPRAGIIILFMTRLIKYFKAPFTSRRPRAPARRRRRRFSA